MQHKQDTIIYSKMFNNEMHLNNKQ